MRIVPINPNGSCTTHAEFVVLMLHIYRLLTPISYNFFKEIFSPSGAYSKPFPYCICNEVRSSRFA
jgi:hypothetical protein